MVRMWFQVDFKSDKLLAALNDALGSLKVSINKGVGVAADSRVLSAELEVIEYLQEAN